MRIAGAAWSNTVKYRPKTSRYIIYCIHKKREDIFQEDMFLCMLVQSGEYEQSCPVSQQQTYGNARTFLLLFLHCAFGILLDIICRYFRSFRKR